MAGPGARVKRAPRKVASTFARKLVLGD